MVLHSILKQRMERRYKGQRAWLKTNYPDVFQEQKHLQEGSVERAYWHYGYMMALRDMLEWVPSETN